MQCWWQSPPAAAAGYELELRAERRAGASPPGAAGPGDDAAGQEAHRPALRRRPCAAGQAGLRQAQRMTGEGATVTQAARILKISRSTALREARAGKQPIYVAYMCRLLA